MYHAGVFVAVMVLTAQTAFPDLTIVTRTSLAAQQGYETTTVQIKGTRQRVTRRVTIRGEQFQTALSASITQCDLGRQVLLNEGARIYGIVPVRDELATARALGRVRPQVDTRPVVNTITIDAVDTGERRRIGQLEARHVVTTWTSEAKDSRLASARVEDSWFVDLPSPDCQERRSVATGLVMATGSGRTEVKWRGTGRPGFPVMQTDRTTTATGMFEQKTELVAVSAATLPEGLFEIPAGYRPALSRFDGGFDMLRADTWANRASLAWETASAWLGQWSTWARQWWR